MSAGRASGAVIAASATLFAAMLVLPLLPSMPGWVAPASGVTSLLLAEIALFLDRRTR